MNIIPYIYYDVENIPPIYLDNILLNLFKELNQKCDISKRKMYSSYFKNNHILKYTLFSYGFNSCVYSTHIKNAADNELFNIFKYFNNNIDLFILISEDKLLINKFKELNPNVIIINTKDNLKNKEIQSFLENSIYYYLNNHQDELLLLKKHFNKKKELSNDNFLKICDLLFELKIALISESAIIDCNKGICSLISDIENYELEKFQTTIENLKIIFKEFKIYYLKKEEKSNYNKLLKKTKNNVYKSYQKPLYHYVKSIIFNPLLNDFYLKKFIKENLMFESTTFFNDKEYTSFHFVLEDLEESNGYYNSDSGFNRKILTYIPVIDTVLDNYVEHQTNSFFMNSFNLKTKQISKETLPLF